MYLEEQLAEDTQEFLAGIDIFERDTSNSDSENETYETTPQSPAYHSGEMQTDLFLQNMCLKINLTYELPHLYFSLDELD